jgi:N-acetylglucosaminyldiphosphoundecaprenol N-acetyl-beta-D-mannosaminyltransferase
MRKDGTLRDAVCGSDLMLADGQAVVWACGLLGTPLPERVAGNDLFTGLLAQAQRRGYRVYFLGARAEVLDAMLTVLASRYPGLVVAGYRDGYFAAGQEAQVAAAIKASGADLLFIGMSSPRKELFAARWGEATGARVVHGVGGSFDVLAGLVKRAPAWWQRHGLEWLYNVAFIMLVARAAVVRAVAGAVRDAGGDRS